MPDLIYVRDSSGSIGRAGITYSSPDLLAGFILGLYLVYFQFFGGGAFRHLGLMMLDILIITIGLQIVIFGFVADMFRKD